MVLLSFDLPSLNEIVLESSQEAPGPWRTATLISFISRSSCMITSFTLRKVSLSDLDLCAVLQVIPSLLHFEIDDYNPQESRSSPITSHLISSLTQHISL
ncbi:hypothetical protein BDP27DRAFT_1333237 [Rhodocollybia butyracea]|uniref:Uncharacterized protein n=1 Tax=Rhodocollybia butyracea TaxID=206335 RepID=A0A9P5PIT9_9AGAR|nr:hypothetical protein BDP27DRAFT_1333237 [Rhodocollybia butyracea]